MKQNRTVALPCRHRGPSWHTVAKRGRPADLNVCNQIFNAVPFYSQCYGYNLASHRFAPVKTSRHTMIKWVNFLSNMMVYSNLYVVPMDKPRSFLPGSTTMS